MIEKIRENKFISLVYAFLLIAFITTMLSMGYFGIRTINDVIFMVFLIICGIICWFTCFIMSLYDTTCNIEIMNPKHPFKDREK